MATDSPDLVVHHHLGYDPVAANMLQRVGGKGPLGTVVHDGPATWRVVRTSDGPGTVRMVPTPEGADVQAWGPGAEKAAASVPDLLGIRDDPTALVAEHPVIREAQRRRRFDRMTRTNTVWEHLIPTILGQKVPTAAMRAGDFSGSPLPIFNPLSAAIGDEVHGASPDGGWLAQVYSRRGRVGRGSRRLRGAPR